MGFLFFLFYGGGGVGGGEGKTFCNIEQSHGILFLVITLLMQS